MNFLTPFYALAAAAVVAPILFHLVRRRPKERVEFSTHLFLEPAPPQIHRSSRIENWILLLLRGLALSLIALAFARPYWGQITLEQSPPKEVQRIVLVDTSASMQREGFIETAKKKAREWIEKSVPQDLISIYTFDESLTPVYRSDSSTGSNIPRQNQQAIDSLEALKATWYATDLGTALRIAVENSQQVLDDAETGATIPTEIIVITDMQQGTQLSALTTIAWPEDCKVYIDVVDGPAELSSNATATLLVSDSDELGTQVATPLDPSLGDRLPIRLPQNRDAHVYVTNSQSSLYESFDLEWLDSFGNKVTDGLTTNTVVPPSSKRVVRMPPPPSHASILEIRGDGVQFDNRFYFTPVSPTHRSVLVIEPTERQSENSLGFFLKQVPMDSETLEVTVDSVTASQMKDFEDWDSMAMIVGSGDLDSQTLQSVANYTQDGGYFVWVWDSPANQRPANQRPDETNDSDESAFEPNYPRLYREAFGGDIGSVSESAGKQYAMWERIDFTHRLFAGFDDAKFRDFTKIRFWDHRVIELQDPELWTVPVRFDDRFPAILQRKVGSGMLTILATGWQPERSQLALSSKFVPLVLNLMSDTQSDRSTAKTYTLGESVLLPASAKLEIFSTEQGNVVEFSAPGDRRIETTEGSIQSVRLSTPGLYRLTNADNEELFAVNFAKSESQLGTLDRRTLVQSGVPLTEISEADAKSSSNSNLENPTAERRAKAVELESSQGVWRWLLCCVVGLVAMESLIANRNQVRYRGRN